MTKSPTDRDATQPGPDNRHVNEAPVKPGKTVPIPEGAQFFREANDTPRLTPVSPVAAQRGDIVVLPDRRPAATWAMGGSF